MSNLYLCIPPVVGVLLAYAFKNSGLEEFQFLSLFGIYLYFLCFNSFFFNKLREAQMIFSGLLSFIYLMFSFLFAAYHQIPEPLLVVEKVIFLAAFLTFFASKLFDDDDDDDGGTFQKDWYFFDSIFSKQTKQPERVYIRIRDF